MKKGYTLIEVLTTIFIFLTISGAITGLFLSSVRTQRRILASQGLFDNVSYVLEYMGRALRMAKKDEPGDCLGSAMQKYNYSTSTYGDTTKILNLRFLNHDLKCQEFYLKDDGRIYQRLSTNASSTNFGSAIALTPSDLLISTTTSKFEVEGAAQPPDDNLQPRVTIFLDVETRAAKPEAKVKLKIQTTISQRNLDVQVP